MCFMSHKQGPSLFSHLNNILFLEQMVTMCIVSSICTFSTNSLEVGRNDVCLVLGHRFSFCYLQIGHQIEFALSFQGIFTIVIY